MDPADKAKLRKNRKALVEDLSVGDVEDHLYQEDIFSKDDWDGINSENARQQKTRKLLDTLQTAGPKAFEVFLTALKETKPHLALLLDPDQDPSHLPVCTSISCADLIKKLSLELQNANAEINTLKGQMQEKDTQIVNAHAEIKRLKRQMEKKDFQHENTCAQIDKLKGKIKSLEALLKKRNKEVDRLIANEKRLKEKLDQQKDLNIQQKDLYIKMANKKLDKESTKAKTNMGQCKGGMKAVKADKKDSCPIKKAAEKSLGVQKKQTRPTTQPEKHIDQPANHLLLREQLQKPKLQSNMQTSEVTGTFPLKGQCSPKQSMEGSTVQTDNKKEPPRKTSKDSEWFHKRPATAPSGPKYAAREHVQQPSTTRQPKSGWRTPDR